VRILYAISDWPAQLQFAQTMKLLGYEINLAGNGQQILNKAISWSPDIIFMTLRLPVIDGLLVTRMIRRQSDIMHIPIIIMADTHDAHRQFACLSVGVNRFLVLPFEIEFLLNTIQELIDR